MEAHIWTGVLGCLYGFFHTALAFPVLGEDVLVVLRPFGLFGFRRRLRDQVEQRGGGGEGDGNRRDRIGIVEQAGEAGDLPPLSLLDPASDNVETVSPETIEFTSRLIEKKLSDFGVAVTVVTAQAGPVITRYEIEPATGVKGSQIVNLAKDLARALSLVSIRVVADGNQPPDTVTGRIDSILAEICGSVT